MIQIRPSASWGDFLQCEEVQRAVWPSPDHRDVVPASLLITAHKNAGLLLGAFDDERMVGFVFGFLGAEGAGRARRYKHCSHMLAVLPAFRSQGLGFRLKERQREFLLAQGVEWATWTYDPLQSVNAVLNLRRLGGVARRYLREAYGEMLDSLNAGVASDRFEVEWDLTSPRVARAVAGDRAGEEQRAQPAAEPVYRIAWDKLGLPHVSGEGHVSSGAAWVEIPTDFIGLRTQDLALAREWRAATRATFEQAFAQGLTAVDAYRWRDEAGRERAGYLLSSSI